MSKVNFASRGPGRRPQLTSSPECQYPLVSNAPREQPRRRTSLMSARAAPCPPGPRAAALIPQWPRCPEHGRQWHYRRDQAAQVPPAGVCRGPLALPSATSAAAASGLHAGLHAGPGALVPGHLQEQPAPSGVGFRAGAQLHARGQRASWAFKLVLSMPVRSRFPDYP